MENQRPHVPSNPLTQTIVNRVEFVSAQMIGTAGFTSHDRDDIRQILFREVIMASDNFRPDRGSYHTFAYKVILAARAQIYRDRIA